MRAQGWYRDPFGGHEDRWFSEGRPTGLVRDQGVESRAELPTGEPHGPLVPISAAPPGNAPALPAPGEFPAQERNWRFWTVLPPVLLAGAAAVLIIGVETLGLAMNGFDFSYPARWVDWAEADMAGQFVAGLAAAASLIAAGSAQRWRRVIVLSAWGILPWQIGWALLTGRLGGVA